MNRLTECRPAVRILLFIWTFTILILAWATLAGAQSASPTVYSAITTQATIFDPSTLPATFNGAPDMGPWAWVDGPAYLQQDPQLTHGVFAGLEGTNRMFVCRAKLSDGAHPGKFFNGMCNAGWGGVEKVQTSGYELLVNTKPELAEFLSQAWVNPATAASATFQGGSTATTPMRVARATYNNGVHAGKEWEGRCNIGWGGKEVGVTPYEVLSLGFNKAAWQAAQSPAQPAPMELIITGDLSALNKPLDPSQFNFEQSKVVVQHLWTPDYLGTGLATLADDIPGLLTTMIDEYNAALTNQSLRKDRQSMVTALKNGDAETQGIIIVKMIDRAKSIMDRSQSTWTSEEGQLIKFLQALGQNQLQKAGVFADQAFKDWQVQWTQEQGTGMYGLINPAVNPPQEILMMARYGYAVTPDISLDVAKIIAGSAGAVTATGGAIVATLTGLGGTIAATVSAGIAGAGISATAAATAAGVSSAASGAVAGPAIVVTAMVTAGVLKGIEVFQYEEYKSNLAAAIEDSKDPMSLDKLKSFLNSDDGQKAVLTWLSVQAAKGTTY